MSAADWPAWHDGPGVHESGLHVWTFRDDDTGEVSVEIDAECRLTLTQARAFAAQLTGVLDAIDPQAPAAHRATTGNDGGPAPHRRRPS